MQTFKISPEGFKEIRKKALIRTIPMLMIAGAVGITISVMNQKETDVNVLPFIIPIAALVLGFGIYRGINRQKALLDSYTLIITSNLVTREQLNTPTISIYYNDITEIAKNKNGNYSIKGKEASDVITIPMQIENHSELETALQRIHPIVSPGEVTLLEKYQSLTGFLTLGLMGCVYVINNKIIVAITGTALVVLMIWSLIKIRSSKNVDSKTKNGAWWVLIVLASVIAIMIFKLTGFVDMKKN